ncbi:acyltransferase family protein [Flaviaesturariibacter terrae]
MKSPRFYALDVFRGATVALMILVNNPGSWGHIYSPLEHAEWNGLTPTDLVFPFFLFAVGNAMAFVMPRFAAAGDGAFWRKVLKRTALIFLIGLFLNWWPFVRWQGDALLPNGWTWWAPAMDNVAGIKTGGQQLFGIRILGVLQRIALCYFAASVIVYYLKPRGALFTGLVILLVYWALCFCLGDYTMPGFFGNGLDRAVLGIPHMYNRETWEGFPQIFDPEGLASTLPAITQVIFGYLVGHYIVNSTAAPTTDNAADRTARLYRTLTGLFVTAVGLLVAGYMWDLVFPVNKRIWTSSYVLATTGMAILVLGTLLYAIELRGVRGGWTRFFDVFGKNALFVFALSAFLPRGLRLLRIPNGVNEKGEAVYTNPWNFLYDKVYKLIPGDPRIGSLFFALTVILFMWAICYWMDKKRIYVKV